QGPVDFRRACEAAAAKGITINTIFCGPKEEGVRTGWRQGAAVGLGAYAAIDQDCKLVAVAAPQDKELIRLSVAMNATYVPYGSATSRTASATNQSVQDRNALAISSSVAADRACYKGGTANNNMSWDLVDACNQGKVRIEEVPAGHLTDAVRSMNLAQRR